MAATFNNFPVDVMLTIRGGGRVIGVDLNFRKPRRIELDHVPGSWALLRDRLRPLQPRPKRRYKLPSLPSYLMNVTILYSMSRQRQAQKLTDLYFNPPLDRVGMLAWNKYDQIVQQGYKHGVEVLGQVSAETLRGFAESVNRAVETIAARLERQRFDERLLQPVILRQHGTQCCRAAIA